MRIIAGQFRGRRLLDPADATTRPVTDRVKQTIFDILSANVPEAVVWDVFAGTGSFGLEALSRGAKQVIFFERHKPAVERLRRNIETLQVENRARVVLGDLFRLIPGGRDLPLGDVVFFDPPYRFLAERPDELRELLTAMQPRLNEGHVVVLRHDKADSLDLPGWKEIDRREIGSMTVRMLRGE